VSLPQGNTGRAISLTHTPFVISLVILGAVWTGGCNSDGDPAGPAPEPGGPPPGLLGSAIRLHVDMRAGKVTVTQPSVVEKVTRADGLKPSFALLGRNEIEAAVTEVSRSAVGEFTPNRVRVTLGLALTNKLLNSDLVPSTFPAPPAGVNQVVAFPFATNPSGLFGLKVRASSDWDGSTHNFFNDAICIGLTPPGDCFRWEGFGSKLEAGATTATQLIGFDVDQSVTTFTVYIVVAADVSERPTSGSIEGVVRTNIPLSTITSLPVEGVQVSLSPSGHSAITDAGGRYRINELPPGQHSVSLRGSPASCFGLGPRNVLVTTGQVTTADVTLTCRRIAFASNRANPNAHDIFVVNPDGSGEIQLTFGSANDAEPTWSPDGSRLAFVSNRTGTPEIYSMRANGTDVVQLTQGGVQGTPAWSPDGSKIAFTKNNNIYRMNADGTGEVQVTTEGGEHPTWLPTSQRITFSSNRDGTPEIYSVDLNGFDLVRYTVNNETELEPAWSPDGNFLAFSTGFGLGFMNNQGSTGMLTLSFATPHEKAAWSPSGRQVVYNDERGIHIYDLDRGMAFTFTLVSGHGNTDAAW
jgi:WD40 repeat protein